MVEGVKGEWRVDPELLDRPFTGRTVLLSPYDRLVYDRRRTEELFEFEYYLEMYKPAAKRRWGYLARPPGRTPVTASWRGHHDASVPDRRPGGRARPDA